MRVYTGLNQKCPQPEWWGETSTEFAGAEDIHLEASLEAIRQTTSAVNSPSVQRFSAGIYDLQGHKSPRSRRGLNIKNGKKFFIK